MPPVTTCGIPSWPLLVVPCDFLDNTGVPVDHEPYAIANVPMSWSMGHVHHAPLGNGPRPVMFFCQGPGSMTHMSSRMAQGHGHGKATIAPTIQFTLVVRPDDKPRPAKCVASRSVCFVNSWAQRLQLHTHTHTHSCNFPYGLGNQGWTVGGCGWHVEDFWRKLARGDVSGVVQSERGERVS